MRTRFFSCGTGILDFDTLHVQTIFEIALSTNAEPLMEFSYVCNKNECNDLDTTNAIDDLIPKKYDVSSWFVLAKHFQTKRLLCCRHAKHIFSLTPLFRKELI
jgi:hypothetical protein